MRVLGVDPGKHKCGWGVYGADGISNFGYSRPHQFPPYLLFDAVLIELPQIYTHRGSKGDPNDLIPLAFEAGKIAYRYQHLPIATVLPAEWKGQVPKEAMQRRLLESLPEQEARQVQLEAARFLKSVQHNIYDGLMLAMYGYENRERLFK